MILFHLTTVLATITLSFSSIVKPPSNDGKNFELLILHNNDMHARFEQTSQLSGACTTLDREAGKCYGGFPRVATVVKEARRKAASGEGPPVLYLNAGDTYTGTAWFTIYKWKVAAEFLNALQPDAVSLGNHEFDEEVDGVVPFIANLSCPVLAANLILDDVPILEEQSNLHKSVVLTKNGVEIGIIGYLTPDTRFLAPKNDVKYEEEVNAIRKESLRLRRLGVQIIIALGHSGFVKDLEIAEQVEDLDLVIGGHSNTFLTNTNTSEIPEYSEGPYPTLVRQKSGRTVLVVQAYAFTKYLGRLHLVFNAQGEIINFDGNPILLNHNVKQDPIILEIVKRYKLEVNEINSEVVGSSMVFLDGVSCRLKECNLGNFFTDAVVYYTKQHDNVHSNVNIAVIAGGRIRTSISDNVKPFNITKGDLITVIPFSDSLCIITMNGTILKQALEHSVASWRLLDAPGQFLQMSGMDVTYDLAKKVGSRVIRARAICSNCKELQAIKEDYEYKIITSTFLADGGDNYTMFESLPRDVLPYNEVESALYYLSKYSPINTVVSNRIVIFNDDKLKSIPHRNEDKDKTAQLSSTGHHNKAHTAMFFLLLVMNLSLNGRR
ncbi:protein 5NUC-like isoform X3 [Danaus plexippus]|uniref:protein 5NUC-like isoform X2 n=1 Tax=Danaus plexippus TaxID=13037 RepID=UPI002AB02F4A|nr:protein 5NUC-like isoform X2 [Danaus plexippus]XP_061379080.1 protein 5NUC-like isoform X3 [Danaus plexippus]